MVDKNTFLDALLAHVPFDGWSVVSIAAAAAELDVGDDVVRALFPRGPVDAALAYHQRGDEAMVARMAGDAFEALRYSEKIAAGVRYRLEAADRELVRKGMALFALPQNAAIGSGAVWGTASLIWDTLGDTSRDVNWYTKRATLSAVYSSTVLFWLGDDSEGNAATWEFLDRRIDNVMQFEGFKRRAGGNPLVKAFLKGPGRILDHIKAPVGSK